MKQSTREKIRSELRRLAETSKEPKVQRFIEAMKAKYPELAK